MRTSTLLNDLIKDYDPTLSHSGIDGERLAKRLHALSEIGFTEEGGVWRPGFSEEEKRAKALVKGWMAEAGFEVTEDGAGNVIGRLAGEEAESKAIASGSHLDSVPNGGHFDGPLGVLAALEVAEAWKAEGRQPRKPYEMFVFTDEEGSRFNAGLSGSMAMTGEVDAEAFARLEDFDGKSAGEVLTAYGSSLEKFSEAKQDLSRLAYFVELHIEQGKKLEQENQPVGIVSGIAGPSWLEVTFTGQAGHAGNTPMIGRKDPLVAASEFIQRVSEFPGQISETAVATVGKLHVSPNGSNVIPQEVRLTVDIRDIHEHTRDALLDRVTAEARSIGERKGIDTAVRQTTRIKPIPISEKLQAQIAESLEKFGIKPVRIPSGAGHDAMILGRKIPVAMLFARSKSGISHNPKEWTSLNDCVLAVHVLKDFLEELMNEQAD